MKSESNAQLWLELLLLDEWATSSSLKFMNFDGSVPLFNLLPWPEIPVPSSETRTKANNCCLEQCFHSGWDVTETFKRFLWKADIEGNIQ